MDRMQICQLQECRLSMRCYARQVGSVCAQNVAVVQAPARPQEQSLSARSSIESVKDLEFARMRQQINDKDIKIDALQVRWSP